MHPQSLSKTEIAFVIILVHKMKRKGATLSSDSKHRVVECPICDKQMRSDVLKRHLPTHNAYEMCKSCKKQVRSDQLLKHELLCEAKLDETLCNRYSGVHEHMDSDELCSSVLGFFKSYELKVDNSGDYDHIILDSCAAAKPKILHFLSKHPIKAQLVIGLSFYKGVYEETETSEKVFRSICEPLLAGDDIDEYLARAKSYIRHGIEVYERLGSGWIFDGLKCSHIEVAKYSPLSASGMISIPKKIKKMRSVLNITSSDNKCFLYCLLAKLFPVAAKNNSHRHTKYLEHIEKVKMGNVSFPVQIEDISKIEKLNELSISVFQWCLEDECVLPLKHGSDSGHKIDLLYIENDDNAHYLLIKDFNAFMRHRTKHHNTMFYCRKCLHGFVSAKDQESHFNMCKQGINQVVKMPDPGVIEFKANHKQDKKLFAIYFDFECLTVPYSTCNNNSIKSSTEKYQKHVPCSYCIATKSEFPSFEEKTMVFSHEDPETVTRQFLADLCAIHEEMMSCYEKNQFPINMTEDDEANFQSATHCHICKKELQWSSERNYPVRDHDHLLKSNNYRGAACNVCNFNYYNRSKKVPAFAHNLKGYDLNLFLLDLTKRVEQIDVIPETLEKFKAVFTENFIFLDSFAFLSTSLDKLAENLKKSGVGKFARLKKEFPDNYKLLAEKGVYFYDYATSFSVFSEKRLPPKDSFYSKLKDEDISDEDYERAQQVFHTLKCNNLLDYMELYVKTDTLILCDVFENFRTLCLDYYGLDCCHYMSLPGFSWDAMLKMTGCEIEYMTDIEMYTFIEKNLRGGVTTVNHRHFAANNPYLDDYDPESPTSYIHYVDANNLYGKSMSLKLPMKNFRWLNRNEIDSMNFIKIDPEGDTCYIMEVDLGYPEVIHDRHNDFPLAVESKVICENKLSPFNRQFLQRHKEKFKPSRKLCPDLVDKEHFVCSLKNLQLYLDQGLVLGKIHRVLAIDQSDFVTPYINFNSQKRQEAKSDFEKDFFKLANNSIYGKFIESLRNRTNVDIVRDEKTAKRLTSKPQFLGFHLLDEQTTVVQSVKRTVTLNKPIACGFIVLENAKHIMGNFWYNVLKPKYDDKIKLLLSDTDSFIYGVYTNDGYEDLYAMKDLMDLSGYIKNTPLEKFYDPQNKKVPGKFSDEKPTEIIREVIALKPKMYSVLSKKLICKGTNDSTHKCNYKCFNGHAVTAKGITKASQKLIRHEDYHRVLTSQSTTMTKTKTIRSFNNKLYSIIVHKRGLSGFDDKKFILDDGICTLSYGHYSLKNLNVN